MPLRPNVKISQLPTDAVLTGSELVTGIGGDNQNISIDQIAAYVIAQIGGSVTDDFVLSDSGDDFELSLTGDDFILSI